MRDKLDRFIDNTIGQFIEVSYSKAIYQCMDLAYNWTFVLDFPKATIQHLYAYEVYTQASDFTRQYFDVIPNTPEVVVEAGDLVVWNKTSSNVAGHIGIAIEGTKSKFKVYEQNSPLGTNAHISEKNYTNVLGFLRPKIKNENAIPQYLLTLSQEAGIDLFNESEFRIYWEKAKKYDEEINSLKEQVKSISEALADRAGEVSVLTEKNQKLSDSITETQEALNKARSERDKATWEASQLNIKIETLEGEIGFCNKRVSELGGKNPLKSYSWFSRLFSLFGG